MSKPQHVLDRKTLDELYNVQCMSIREIAFAVGKDFSLIRNVMKQYGIQVRSYSEAERNFRRMRPEKWANRLDRSRGSRRTFDGKDRIQYTVRQAIRPFVAQCKEEHPVCTECHTEPTMEVHHVYALADWISDLHGQGVSETMITFSVVKAHYDSTVDVLPRCTRCHKQRH
jgi:hypothetical protein